MSTATTGMPHSQTAPEIAGPGTTRSVYSFRATAKVSSPGQADSARAVVKAAMAAAGLSVRQVPEAVA